MRKSSYVRIAVATGVATLLLAGCGDGGSGGGYGGQSDGTTSESASTAPPPASEATVVSVGSVPEIGRILVDASGHTLYDFHKDKGTKSACYGECAVVWPALITDDPPQAKGGASASKLGVSERTDGTLQVTYAGRPLYTYASDAKPGEANGNDIDSFGAEWYTLMPNGAEPED